MAGVYRELRAFVVAHRKCAGGPPRRRESTHPLCTVFASSAAAGMSSRAGWLPKTRTRICCGRRCWRSRISVASRCPADPTCSSRPTRLHSRSAPSEEMQKGFLGGQPCLPPTGHLAGPARAVHPPPMTNCGSRYAPGCWELACLPSMACPNPAEEPAVPASWPPCHRTERGRPPS